MEDARNEGMGGIGIGRAAAIPSIFGLTKEMKKPSKWALPHQRGI